MCQSSSNSDLPATGHRLGFVSTTPTRNFSFGGANDHNPVVLHVVASMDKMYTTLENGNQVPVLSLGPLLDCQPSPKEPQDLWPLLKVHGYTPPANATKMGVLLDRAGDNWFLGERDGFLALLKKEDPEQVLYASLMEALGYSHNRGPFQELAWQVP